MRMKILQPDPLTGAYALALTPVLAFQEVFQAQSGLCRIAKGRRSPEQGMRTSAKHELAYLIRGRVLVETASQKFEVTAGSILTASPSEPHSTTALEDSEIFFVLLEP